MSFKLIRNGSGSFKLVNTTNSGKFTLSNNNGVFHPPPSTSTTTTTTTTPPLFFSSTGARDTTFNVGTGFDLFVETTNIDSSGKLIVGGQFTAYQGSTQNRLIRLNTDGSKDSSFNIGTGFNNIIYVSAIDSNGKVLVGGKFTSYNGTTQNRLIRLNSDGTKDTSFDIGTGFNDDIWALTVDSNGKILVGGNFTSYNGSSQSFLVRLNSDGSKDTSFDIGTGFVGFTTGGRGLVDEIFVDSNGKILVGGNFTSYRGTSSNYLIRLNSDGTVDNSFSINPFGFDSWVTSIKIDTNGKIVAGGFFELFKLNPQSRIIRLNSDGTKDTSFDIGTGFNTSLINVVVIDLNGKILVGGNFSSYQGSSQPYLIRLNTDGSKDTSFDIGTGPSSLVSTISVDNNGKVIIGGWFSSYNGVTQNYLTRLA